MKLITNADVKNKTVLVRADLNVPIVNGKIEDSTRIKKIIPTVKYLIQNNCKIILTSHFGRPKGQKIKEMSLRPIAEELSKILDQTIIFSEDCIGDKVQNQISSLKEKEIILLENLRFYNDEEDNDKEFAKKLSSLADIYVNDAFSCSHRAHASIDAITNYLPSYAGLLLSEEISSLEKILNNPTKPIAAFVGGSKVSTKLELLNSLVQKVDLIAIGGAMANSFLKAKGVNIGNSVCEESMLDTALSIMLLAEKYNCEILLPIDAVISKDIKDGKIRIVDINTVPTDYSIFDIGPKTINLFNERLGNIKTLVWNGPLGAFEFKPFDLGTYNIALTVSSLTIQGKLVSVAGGGDIVSALNSSRLIDNFTYISTAGGAFLEWLEGKELPGIAALKSDAIPK
ncbi:MAG: phosphoglycerate kinase [Alphaproteobacteria bacterium]